MAKTLNMSEKEFPVPFERLRRLEEFLKDHRACSPSARKLAAEAIARGADVLLAEEKANIQLAEAG